MTEWMYQEPCPACGKPVGFDPYEALPAGFGVPFPCPSCGVRIELDGEDMEQQTGEYDYEYWFVRSTEPQGDAP